MRPCFGSYTIQPTVRCAPLPLFISSPAHLFAQSDDVLGWRVPEEAAVLSTELRGAHISHVPTHREHSKYLPKNTLNAGDGGRTRMPLARQGILSPLCLPVPPLRPSTVHRGVAWREAPQACPRASFRASMHSSALAIHG